MKVVVTGAAGFIGFHLVPGLLGEGYEVTRIVEPGVNAAGAGMNAFAADISSGKDMAPAFSGADVVVHLAARNHVIKETASDPLAEYRRVNVEGTRNVVRAAAAAGARLFVHMSSVKAVREESEEILDEESPCEPKTPYGISKMESERVVAQESAKADMRSVIIRLPMVYGPGNRGNLPRLVRWAEMGRPFPLFKPDRLRSIAYVGNVVAGIMAALRRAPSGASTFFLKDSDDCTAQALYSAICDELGKAPRFLSVPPPMVHLGRLISEDFRKITGSLRVSSSRVEKEIGFVPPVSFKEGLIKTVQWYKCSIR